MHFDFIACLFINGHQHQSYIFTNEYTSDCLKNNIKIYIRIAPTCFGAVRPSSGSSLFVLAKAALF